MKTFITSLFIIGTVLPAANALDIKTRTGRIFHDCTVREITQDGVRIFYAEGITTVDFRDLPPELQKQLHYDAAKGRADYKSAATDSYHWYLDAVREAERKNFERAAAEQAKQAEESRIRAEADLARREREAQERRELEARAALAKEKEQAAAPQPEQQPQQAPTLEQIQQLAVIAAMMQQSNAAQQQQLSNDLSLLQQLQALKGNRGRSRISAFTDSYDPNSLANPYGAGSPYKADGLMNPYSQYGSPYSNKSWTNPYATEAPKLYDANGRYLGRFSTNPYDPDSTSNPYGRYGNKYSPDSINNPYGAGNPYSTSPIYVIPDSQ